MALHRRVFGAHHTRVAALLSRMAGMKVRRGAYDAAFAQYRDVLSRLQNTLGPEHAYIAITLGDLARTQARRSRPEQADSLFDAALRMKRQTLGPGHPRVANTLADRSPRMEADRFSSCGLDGNVRKTRKRGASARVPEYPRASPVGT